jgi:hypothetical protein
MMKDFPITTVPFTPVKELEKKNKAHLKKVEEALKVSDSLSRAATEPEI